MPSDGIIATANFFDASIVVGIFCRRASADVLCPSDGRGTPGLALCRVERSHTIAMANFSALKDIIPTFRYIFFVQLGRIRTL